MPELKILKSRTVYHDAYEDSGHLVFTVRSGERPTEEHLASIGIHARSCGHSFDCCGCWFGHSPSEPRHTKRNEWLVTQFFGRNI